MSIVVAGIASFSFHAAVALGWGLYQVLGLLFPPAPPRPAELVAARAPEEVQVVEIDYPTVASGTWGADEAPPDPKGTPPVPMGGSTVARMQTDGAGRGGDETVAQQALNLSDGDERMTLTLDVMTRLDRDQHQRLKSGDARRSWEDRRSTTHPEEGTFVQNGDGHVQEKRDRSPTDPSRGALMGARASAPGSSQEGAATAGDDAPAREEGDDFDPRALANRGGAHVGAHQASPGAGLASAAAGADHHASADGAHARPDVAQAPVAVPANERDRPMDDEFSDQEISRRVQDIVHASTAGGAPGDEGRGGSGGGGEPAAGGAFGPGSVARPLGASDGDTFELYTTDPRLMLYFRVIKSKIDPLWANAFPKSALLELKQGTVILEFTVRADGSAVVAWPPLKPSGIDEFDRNCANAIRRASPFPPIPASLGRGALRIRAPFVASNPIIK